MTVYSSTLKYAYILGFKSFKYKAKRKKNARIISQLQYTGH